MSARTFPLFGKGVNLSAVLLLTQWLTPLVSMKLFVVINALFSCDIVICEGGKFVILSKYWHLSVHLGEGLSILGFNPNTQLVSTSYCLCYP